MLDHYTNQMHFSFYRTLMTHLKWSDCSLYVMYTYTTFGVKMPEARDFFHMYLMGGEL